MPDADQSVPRFIAGDLVANSELEAMESLKFWLSLYWILQTLSFLGGSKNTHLV